METKATSRFEKAICVVAACLAVAASWQSPARAQDSAHAPMFESQRYSLYRDRVVEGQYQAVAVSPDEIDSNYAAHSGQRGAGKWIRSRDLSGFPEFHSDSVLVDAVYKLSLQELLQDTSKEGTFDAGALWPGAWTRDVSYSILLSLAAIDPEHAKATLLRKVKRNRIVQDTGTGGSWPVSTDRECWALAAWEIYVVTGDREWLRSTAEVIKNSIRDDEAVVIDPVTGLAHGETSFMDWREQTYPRWMEPADIYSSEALGTNAVFYRVYRILGAMDRQLGTGDPEWDVKADRMRAAMNRLFWRQDAGLYGEYLYGRDWPTLSPRTDALGQSLAMLFEVASPEQRQLILSRQPLMPYGVPTVFPETPGIEPYHNRSVWPFVQAFWNWAAAGSQDDMVLRHGLAAMYRGSALFLTNKENLVSDTGSPIGTALNSDRQLWSVAGSLAMIYRVFFGMQFTPEGLQLHPVIPRSFGGTYQLKGFRYRNAVLAIRVHGYGNDVSAIQLDGAPLHGTISVNLAGAHEITVELNNQEHDVTLSNPMIADVKQGKAPETPDPSLQQNTLGWGAVPGASGYRLFENGTLMTSAGADAHRYVVASPRAEVQIASVAPSQLQSFLSKPAFDAANVLSFPVQATTSENGTSPFVTIEQSDQSGLAISANLPQAGAYSIRFRYANGSGPVNTDSKCAVRTLYVDGQRAGAIVLPQRGKNAWDSWGESSAQVRPLAAGVHRFELRMETADLNMDGTVNSARIAAVQLVRLADR